MTSPAAPVPSASARVLELLKSRLSFQISVDTDNVPQGLVVAEAGLAAGVTLVELGTPLLKTEGVRNVVSIFRQRFPDALLLADMKSMDGASYEAAGVYQGGGNVIDFLALAGVASARGVCAVRDDYRRRAPDVPRLAFADILLPHQGPAGRAVEVARQMVDAGVDGVGLHLQLDARRADPALPASSHLADAALAVFEAVGAEVSVQVVGGLSIAQARHLAAGGLRAFVISGNMGLPDAVGRYGLPPADMTGLMATFIREVSAAA